MATTIKMTNKGLLRKIAIRDDLPFFLVDRTVKRRSNFEFRFSILFFEEGRINNNFNKQLKRRPQF